MANATMTHATQSNRTRGRWFVGVPALGLAISLTVAYFRLPNLTANWSVTQIICFRTFVVGDLPEAWLKRSYDWIS